MTRHEDRVEGLLDEYLERRIDRREFFKRASLLGISLGAAGSLLAACGGGGGQEAAPPPPAASTGAAAPPPPPATTAAPAAPVVGGTLREGYDRDVSRTDPVNTTWWDASLFPVIHETVVTQDPDGKFVPMMAESWEQSADGTEITFKIRDGLVFQSGAACDAAAVAEALNVVRKGGINAGFWPPVKDVTAEAGNVVKVTLSHPYADLFYVLNSGYSAIFNTKKRDELKNGYGVKAADGTGPFTLTELVPGSHALVTRWEDYPGSVAPFLENKGKAYLDAVRWEVLLEPATRAQELEAGNVDALHGPAPQDVDRLKGNSDFAVIEFQEWSLYQLGVNYKHTELGFDDVKVRQAFMHAIDRQAIVDTIFFGKASPSYTIVPSAFPYYDSSVEQYGTFDVAMAKSLLDGAGWKEGSGGVREKGGKKLSFEAIVEAYDKTEGLVAQAVQGMLANVGIDMKLKSVQDYYTDKGFFTKDGPVAYIVKNVWPYMFDASLLFTDSTYFLPNCCNGSFTKIPALDKAYEEWQSAADDAGLKAAAQKALAVAAEQVAFVPIVTPTSIWVHHKKVHGWAPNQPNLYPFYNDVWIEA